MRALATITARELRANAPIAIAYPAAWREFWHLNSTRGIDWGTLWYIGAHFPRGSCS